MKTFERISCFYFYFSSLDRIVDTADVSSNNNEGIKRPRNGQFNCPGKLISY